MEHRQATWPEEEQTPDKDKAIQKSTWISVLNGIQN